MLPALTASRRRVTPRRLALAAASAVLTAASVGTALAAPAEMPPPALADALAPSTWAMEVPAAWLATVPAGLRAGDRIDLLATRTGERAYAVPIAFALRVMSNGAGGLVLEVDEGDAVALATARGGGLLIVPILRSTR